MEAMEAENEAAAMEFKRNYHRANQQAQHLREVSRLGGGSAWLGGAGGVASRWWNRPEPLAMRPLRLK